MSDGRSNFGFEIDFLPVGDSSRSGDAICLRWGYDLETPGKRKQYVIVVDGGYTSCGEQIVAHVKKYYGTTHINIVVNTHPHKDHVNGLSTVLEKCDVYNLAIHRPWELSGIKAIFRDGRVTAKGIKDRLKDGLESAYSLVKFARDCDVKLLTPFAPCTWDNQCGVRIHVLGPTKAYYESLLPAFTTTPTDGDQVALGQRVVFDTQTVSAEICPLTDQGETSAENNSSVILAFELPSEIGGGVVLLTGDAGIYALNNAVREARNQQLILGSNVRFLQIPHHGSIQNLGPSVLNSILGRERSVATAYVSVAQDHDNEHPAKHVTNELLKHGVHSYQTAGRTICKSFGKCPVREGWTSLTAIQEYPVVEKFSFSRS